jgi:hypothetical protein
MILFVIRTRTSDNFKKAYLVWAIFKQLSLTFAWDNLAKAIYVSTRWMVELQLDKTFWVRRLFWMDQLPDLAFCNLGPLMDLKRTLSPGPARRYRSPFTEMRSLEPLADLPL